MTFREVLSSWIHWFDEAMPDTTQQSFRLKFVEEAAEFNDEPSLDEAVDAFTCLLGWMHRGGLSLKDLEAALVDKLQVNQARTWERREDGTYKHVKT